MGSSMLTKAPEETSMHETRASVLSARAQDCSSERAFTLIELMTVVIIVGILATLATYGVRKYIMEAKKAEASSMLVQIRAAEEAYKAETFEYEGLNEFTAWHPVDEPGTGKRSWQVGSGTAMTPIMNRLGVMPDGPVAYSYSVVARASGSPPTIPTVKTWDFPDSTGPFYIAMAKADLNGDGVYTYALSHSDTAEIYIDDTF
jgi:prepilin-type N-terminal cleavage/methylation domain-containing protein